MGSVAWRALDQVQSTQEEPHVSKQLAKRLRIQRPICNVHKEPERNPTAVPEKLDVVELLPR